MFKVVRDVTAAYLDVTWCHLFFWGAGWGQRLSAFAAVITGEMKPSTHRGAQSLVLGPLLCLHAAPKQPHPVSWLYIAPVH